MGLIDTALGFLVGFVAVVAITAATVACSADAADVGETSGCHWQPPGNGAPCAHPTTGTNLPDDADDSARPVGLAAALTP